MNLTKSVQGMTIEEGVRRLTTFLHEELPSPIMDEALAIMLRYTRQRFLNTTAPDGTKWERSGAAIKREEVGRGGDTLFDTGRLFHSIQVLNNQNGTGEIYTDVPYAAKHQNGEPPMPKREFIGIGPEEAIITAIITRRLQEISNG